jgi:hypothetical protein
MPAVPTHADSARGADNPNRSWWDVTYYDLNVRLSPRDSSFSGWNRIAYRAVQAGKTLQLDLQAPLELDSVVQGGKRLEISRDSDAYLVTLPASLRPGASAPALTAYYHGQPGRGRPPRSSGVVWSQDSLGAPGSRPPISSSARASGGRSRTSRATSRQPADRGHRGRFAGRGLQRTPPRQRAQPDGSTTYEWFVSNPINSYGVAVNAGRYAHFADTLQGESGPLTLDFWALAPHVDTARVIWAQAKTMLSCFEHWLGPYPWYADGYKLIEAPYLGMEHQSGIAYGNKFLPATWGGICRGRAWVSTGTTS